MGRLDLNRSGELEVFVRVVELGSFSAAARAFGMTPSAVSRLVLRLETRLGVRLLNRSTRLVQLTPEGATFHERGARVLADLDAAEQGVSAPDVPRGRLRVSANVPFGHRFLIPLLPGFLARYPEVTVDATLTDVVIDILEQKTDVAVRAGPLKSSTLMARKLGQTGKLIVGAPDYLARCGTPRTPADLAGHNLLGFNYRRATDDWPLRDGDRIVDVPVAGNALISDGDALRRLTVAGAGLSRLARFQAEEDLATGRLVAVLEDCNPGDVEEVHAVFLDHGGGPMPPRVRVFLDWLVAHVRFDDGPAHPPLPQP